MMPSSNHDKIAKMVCSERRKRGWTQQELADKSGISRVSIGYVEAGSRNLSLGTLEKLASAFGLNVDIKFKKR